MPPKVLDIGQFFHRFLQWTITGLLGAVLFFVKENYNDFRKMQGQVEDIRDKQTLQESHINYLDIRVTKLEK